MSVDHSGHRQRLKRALRENGLMSFSPHEVIELMLYTALPRRDVNELAHRIDEAAGGVSGLLAFDKERMMSELGLSENVAGTLESYCEAVRAYEACANRDCRRLLTRGERDAFLREIALPDSRVLVLLSSGREVIFTCRIPGDDCLKFVVERVLRYDAALVMLICPEHMELEESELERLSQALNRIDAKLEKL